MARRNIDAFLATGADRIVTCSAGCGSSMKEYEELLKDDPVYSEKARQASEMTRDINELLMELPFRRPSAHLERQVTYQDPCHLAHAQRISAAPRTISAVDRRGAADRDGEPVDVLRRRRDLLCGAARAVAADTEPKSRGDRRDGGRGGNHGQSRVQCCSWSRDFERQDTGFPCGTWWISWTRRTAWRSRRRRGEARHQRRRDGSPEPSPLQLDLEQARASQLPGSRRRGPFGLLPGLIRRQPRSR